jgi:predicted secreted protein
MGKTLGKLTKFSFNGADVPLKGTDFDESFDVIDVTDNATTGDGTETVTSRATRSITIQGILKNAGGDKLTGKAITYTHNSILYKLTDFNYDVSFDEVDLTDGGTSGDGTEFDVGRAERKLSFDYFQLSSVAEIARNVNASGTLAIATGVSVAGTFRPETLKVKTEMKSGNKVSVTGSFQGAVTETSVGLACATSGAVILCYDDGTTTDKAITGTAVLMSKKISGSIKGEITFSYTFKISGAIAETLKA